MQKIIYINDKKDFLNVSFYGNPANPAVLILHGFPEDALSFNSLALELVKNNYHVIAPNQRGYIGSVLSENLEDYSINNLSDDIISLISILKLENITIIGHDWGGVLTWNLIDLIPELLKKVIIISAPHPVVMKNNLFKNPIQILKSWYIFLFQMNYLPEKILSLNQFKFFSSDIKNKTFNKNYDHENLNRLIDQLNQNKNFKYMINWYRAMKFYKNSKRSNLSKVHVDLLWGDKDPYLSIELANQSKGFAEQVNLIKLANISHWPHHENKEEFNKLILRLIS